MLFALIVVVALIPIRRTGWAISKGILYQVPLPVSVFLTMIWASLIWYMMHTLIRWQDPNIVFKIIFAYGFGSYLSIPNFGLFAQSTLPPEEVKRTAFIYIASLLSFAGLSIVFAFFD
jgi:hypothetical protein